MPSWHFGLCVCVCLLLQALCMFGLNCLLAGWSVALTAGTFHRHAMRCRSGTSNSFAFLDSTAFWRGGLMHGSFGRQSEANIECAEFFLFCVAVDAGFCSGKTIPRNMDVLFTVFGSCC